MIRCGVYLRLSREDGMEESNSIQNQRLLVYQYISRNPDLLPVGEWVDDGWSGSRFDRPGFQGMMGAVLEGKLDCIVVKDLSRLGREYIQTGRYLQEIFPKLGIRFIAIADHYDSMQTEFMEQSLMVPVLNLMNDAYCRDISQKVRWQQQTKRQLGEYIGAFAVYGYRKDDTHIHRLVMDREAAEIVKVIYHLRLSGMAAENIAKALNRQNIPSPRTYKWQQGSKFCCGFDRETLPGWSPLAVRRILHNKMYTGMMIQGKDRKISYKLDIRERLPEEQWICVDDMVPILISRWVFQRVETLEKKRLRCKKGKCFCEPWVGILQGQPGGEHLEKELLSFLYKKFLGEENQSERWMCRLFLVLFFEAVEVISENKTIILYTTFRRESCRR